MNLSRLRENLDAIRGRIEDAAARAGRPAGAVRLVAVTKKQPVEVIPALLELGQSDLGENYPQELWARSQVAPEADRTWHLIGHLQGNKVRRTFPLVRFIHAVDSLKLLRHLDEESANASDPPTLFLQINCSGEAAKHGWAPDAILDDAEAIAACRHARIAGVMTMAGYDTTPDEARPAFRLLREVRDRLAGRSGLTLPELSMGMSGDFEAAIEEGATWIRVGSAIFEGVTS